MAAEEVRVGPFRFEFQPDGDDDGVGAVLLHTSSAWSKTPFQVPRAEWEEFAGAVSS